MDYHRHYALLIARSKDRTLSGPTELHHIVPRCMGGSNHKSNLAALTPEEHFVAHQLLTKMYPNHLGLATAAAAMALDQRNGTRSNNKLYGWLRRRAARAESIRRTGVKRTPETIRNMSIAAKASEAIKAHNAKNIGVPRSEEIRRKLSKAAKSSEKAKLARSAMHSRKKGVPRTSEERAKMSASHTGKKQTKEHCERISAALKGRTFSDGHRANLSKANTGKPGTRLGAKLSEETKAKMRAAALRRYAAARDLAQE